MRQATSHGYSKDDLCPIYLTAEEVEALTANLQYMRLTQRLS